MHANIQSPVDRHKTGLGDLQGIKRRLIDPSASPRATNVRGNGGTTTTKPVLAAEIMWKEVRHMVTEYKRRPTDPGANPRTTTVRGIGETTTTKIVLAAEIMCRKSNTQSISE